MRLNICPRCRAEATSDDKLCDLCASLPMLSPKIEAAGHEHPRCPSCRGALPGGCSTCRPMRPYRLSQVAGEPLMLNGSPCDLSSLSALVGAVASHHRSDSEWKRDVFTPTPETM